MHPPCTRHESSVGRRAGPRDLAVWVARAPTGALRDPGGLHIPGGRSSSGSREQGAGGQASEPRLGGRGRAAPGRQEGHHV